jgi:hypothetical protein
MVSAHSCRETAGEHVVGILEGIVSLLELILKEHSNDNHSAKELRACAPSAIECLCLFLQQSEVGLLAIEDTSDVSMQRLALLLCQCTTRTERDLLLPTATAIGVIGQYDSTKREEEFQRSRKYQGLFEPKINALLSNALLRSLESCIASKEAIIKSSAKGATIANAREFEVLRDVTNVMSVLASAFIELHTSDDPEIAKNFVRLEATKKLNVVLINLGESVALLGKKGGDRDCADVEMRNDSDHDEDVDSDDESMDPDYEETIENLRSFIEYKSTSS